MSKGKRTIKRLEHEDSLRSREARASRDEAFDAAREVDEIDAADIDPEDRAELVDRPLTDEEVRDLWGSAPAHWDWPDLSEADEDLLFADEVADAMWELYG